ncbi:MAG: undecaprenyl-diphosphatase UppP [Ignavibacteria bacterium]|nr:undecaprenyl-diphosphatase UppP [Ignavibacteria bacterium]
MSIFHSLLLGIIQGLTEFLPVSSTAHLTIAGKLLGLISPEHPERWTAFVAVIQLGTLAAVLLYFAKDISNITTTFIRENLGAGRLPIKNQSLNARLGWMIGIGSVPIVVIGIGLKKIIEGNLTKDLTVIACSLIGLALVLAIAERVASFKKNIDHVTWWDSILVGIAQSLALIPGASRSGTTITAGLFLGMTRETAARFSFLLSIPAVLGSGLLELKHALGYITSDDVLALVIATVAAFLSGYLSIAFLLKFLRSKSTFVFVVYRIALGVLLLVLVKAAIIQP